jgi:hypothetical protein
MKVALLLTGLPRKVEEGYENYWKNIVENYNTDVYLHFWEEEEYEKVLEVYNPKKYICEKPFKFTEYKIGISSSTDVEYEWKHYDVADSFRVLPMFYGWQSGYQLIEGEYDCIIRSRYDMSSPNPIKLENLDLSKINVSSYHWPVSEILDDNLCISNHKLSNMLFADLFDEFISFSKTIGTIEEFNEKNFTNILYRKDLYKHICKSNELPFQLLRKS